MLGSLISAAVRGVVAALIAPILGWIRDRGLIRQGAQQQQQADLAATVKEASDAQGIDARARSASDVALDAELRAATRPDK